MDSQIFMTFTNLGVAKLTKTCPTYIVIDQL